MTDTETCLWTDDDGTQCDREPHARGYCNAHYQRIRRIEKGGDTMADDKQPSGKGQGQTGGKGASKKGKKGAGPMPVKAEIASLLSMLGLGVYAYNPVDGRIIMEGADRLADALYNLAKESPAVRKALVAALAGSAWGQLGAALMPILLPIAANHGLVDSELVAKVGAPVPDATMTPPADGGASVSSLFGNMTAPTPANGEPEGSSIVTPSGTPDPPSDDG